MTSKPEYLLEVTDLRKHFPLGGGLLGRGKALLLAVDGISFAVRSGETLGIVGESGCGKTTAGKCILRLIEPTAGSVVFEGRDIVHASAKQMREIRRRIQFIFQDPYSSLNPRMSVGQIVGEALTIHGICSGREKQRRVEELIDRVGLASESVHRYPHEFSGGQRQRVGIARALALNPALVICDEPVSALDVSIQSQVLNLMRDIQRELGITYLFISHGLAAVKHISTRVGVMYLGKLVELAPTAELYAHPLHPYTEALLSAIPVPDPDVQRNRIILEGDVPNPVNPPSGCRFHTRCRSAMPVCMKEEPEWRDLGREHRVACHLY
ncbi:MAG: dipeptide ABC transporter ATP-binding protein [Syntrophobacteraceae bacterium]|nr:dipeptide ABC transporter ATP-binding protein [Desulfobacteraceae bacterium]